MQKVSRKGCNQMIDPDVRLYRMLFEEAEKSSEIEVINLPFYYLIYGISKYY